MKNEDKAIDAKRELILDAARRLIGQYGLGKTTLDDIANTIGMKKSSLYYYYKNKEDIMYEVMMREKSVYLSIVRDALGTEGSTYDKIINYEKEKANYLKKAISPFDITVNQFIEIKKSVKAIFKNIECDEKHLIAEVISNGIKKNEIKKCNKEKIAQAILNVSEAIRFREYYSAETLILKEIDFDIVLKQIEEIINLIFDGIKK